MTDDTRTTGIYRWIPKFPDQGPIERSAVDYAFKAWIVYHAVLIIDPFWIDIPFTAVAVFAVIGAAKGLDQTLQSDTDHSERDR